MKFKKIAAAVLAAAVLAATPATVKLFSPLSVTANAEDTLTEGDYSYTTNEDGETVTITKYTGTDAEVDIPGTLGGKNVTSIGGQAFFNYKSLISVTIPDSVTTIDIQAFSYCESLTSLTIPDSVTEIGCSAFDGCTSLTNITIPDSVTDIGSSAFEGCTSLTSITIPDSVTEIGDYAFRGCISLEKIIVKENNNNYSSVDGLLFNKDMTELVCYPAGKKDTIYTIPTGVTRIDSYAFFLCKLLTNVTISNTVTKIDYNAFEQCTSLTDVIIPNGVTTIDNQAFYACTSLTSITIPDSVTTISYGTFADCKLLEGITVGENNTNYLSVDGVLFNSEKSELVCYPAGKKNKLYTIPDSVKTIGYDAFFSCDSLTSVTIPKNVTTIYNNAFSYCESLTTVNYGGTKADWEAIEIDEPNECLTNAEIICTDGIINERELNPGDVFVDGDLEYRVLEDGTLEVTGFASDDLRETVTELIIPEEVKGMRVKSIGYSAFNCSVITNVIIPDGVTNIEKAAFTECHNLTSATIPDSVTIIGDNAFGGCPRLTNVKIPEGITEIGDSTFLNCAFASIEIPNSVTTINKWAFDHCNSLTSVTIPKSVTTIVDSAFNRCYSIEKVYYNGIKAEWEAIEIGEYENECLTNAEIICADGIINERDPETSEPDTSEPTTSDTNEPTSSETSEPTSSETSEPTSSDTSEPTSSDTSEPTSSNTSEPTTSTPTDPDLFIKENEVSTEIEVPTEAEKIPESDRITSITINPAFNMKNKHDNNVELDLSRITIKAEAIYDKEGLKRAEEALGETIKGNKHYNLLDLTLLYNGEDFSNGYEGLVKVIIPLPKGHRDKNFSCFRLTEVDGKMVKELIPGEQTEDSYIIYLEHFSLYALVADANPDDGEKQPEESKAPAESASVIPGDTDKNSGNNSGNDQANTGIALAAAPVVIACAAVIAASKKRK